MKKVTSADSVVLINHYKNILTSEGIESFIRNEHLGSLMGEVPFQEVWPELWVKRDLDYDRARQLIDADTLLEESSGTQWTCSSCNEENEPTFGVCWNCGEPA